MSEIAFKLPSFAKINWILRIRGKREDGFHELCTVFQTVSLHDNLYFSENSNVILTCDQKHIPTDENNLVVRAALMLRKKFDIKQGAKIHLEKNIPAPGGLGGGSSNAAIALVGLAKLWNLKISLEELADIGRVLGSDVPFFLRGGTAGATGRGTDFFSMRDLVENYILIVTPNINVSTARAYALLNAPRLTKLDSKSILQICRVEAEALNLRQSGLINDFENAVFKIEPEIERVKKTLLKLKAKHALMSGSGASVFALFDSKKELQTAFDALESEKSWRKFRVKTVSREDYLASIKTD